MGQLGTGDYDARGLPVMVVCNDAVCEGDPLYEACASTPSCFDPHLLYECHASCCVLALVDDGMTTFSGIYRLYLLRLEHPIA